MKSTPLHIVLADDSESDRFLFKLALDEIPVLVQLAEADDGEELMNFLIKSKDFIPDVLFLDLNMPRKNGYECLAEIKQTEKLKHLPVVIFSNAFNEKEVHTLYKAGAQYYIQKQANFSKLVMMVTDVINLIKKSGHTKPTEENFVLSYV